jgi:hypothetical protein
MGKAPGTRMRLKTNHRPAQKLWAMSRIARLTCLTPVSVFTTMTKQEKMKIVAATGPRPRPKKTTMSGTKAADGLQGKH